MRIHLSDFNTLAYQGAYLYQVDNNYTRMRKQALVHLHGLLAEVRTHCTQEADFSEYESLAVGPSSVHGNKDEHLEAVFALTTAITDDLGSQRAGAPPVNTV